MVGKSTFGSAATGSMLKAAIPNTRMPSIRSDVAIGRRIKGSEILIALVPCGRGACACARTEAASSGRRRFRFGQPHARPVGQAILPIDDDFLARRKPFGDDGDAVLHRGDLYRAALDGVVVLDDIGIGAVRSVL